MSVAIITGAAGLVGSAAVHRLHAEGFDIVGIENDMRGYFFGATASTASKAAHLSRTLANYEHFDADIRDTETIDSVFSRYGRDVELVVHAAAQPSHDWAASEPATDFSINATGSLNLLETTRNHCPHAVFIFTSTNKVYGDAPNRLPFREAETRWEVVDGHPVAKWGIDETMSIDQSLHSLFGASKVAADLLVQEYGRYFYLKTGIFRAGCLTGPDHAGAEQHGFLAYLVKCAVTGTPYTVYGFKGKQVRDNMHCDDLIEAFLCFFREPRCGEVYNIGGGPAANCSVLEAISLCEEVGGKRLKWQYSDKERRGDHRWWISDIRKFQSHYRDWRSNYGVRGIVESLVEGFASRDTGSPQITLPTK